MILITGGAGFIGSNLVRRYNQFGRSDIHIIDRLDDTDKYKNLVPLRFMEYTQVDNLFNDINFDQITTIYHLGACSSTTEKDCEYLVRNNYEYTKELFHIALQNNIRFIYASSAATYGKGHMGMCDSIEDISIYHPLNMYGYSKHLFDLYLQNHNFLDKATGLKYFNVFGHGEDHKGNMRSVINKAVLEIRKTGKLQLFKSNDPEIADGEQTRDFLYVRDAVDMTIHLGERSEMGLFNIGTGISHTWNYLANCIFAAMNKQPEIEYIDMPIELSRTYQNRTKANITKLINSGYTQDITPLKDAVFEYVAYLEKKLDGYL